LGRYSDRYTYRYGAYEIGSGGPLLTRTLTGTPPPTRLSGVLALDDVPLAWTRGHGQAMAWFA
jgi:hypothetical protein